MASEGQIKYIKGLAEQRDTTNLDPYLKGTISTQLALENLSNAQVSEILVALKQLPYKPKQPDLITALGQSLDKSELALLEEKTMKGRYFVVDPTDNTEKFFKVDKPEPPSKWAGYTFLATQASDYFYPIKVPSHKLAVLKAIAEDPINAMNEYGIRLGVCGMCGRTLTNRDSRLRGMGPICAGKVLATPQQLDLLDRLGLRNKEREDNNDE